ncbi:hypothetical protein GCM10022252_76280 [Streptosporangium oxazolinicum]|uniref:Phage holin family protein n=1 Tax=Streptosporangium oxazolinicum TaxID=909287 RepID=A0ABP8BL50_9ACTN
MSTSTDTSNREALAFLSGCGAFLLHIFGSALLIGGLAVAVLADGVLAGILWTLITLLVIAGGLTAANRTYKKLRRDRTPEPVIRPTVTKTDLN